MKHLQQLAMRHSRAAPTDLAVMTRLAAAAALSLLPLLAAAPARAAVQFTVTNLGTLGGATSEAFAINASGQVAGRAYLANGTAHATRWTNAVAQDLGTLGGQFSNAYGINDAGQVAGDAFLADNVQYHGVLWALNGTPLALPFPGYVGVSASALNSSGVAVGATSPNAGIASASVWRGGQWRRLPTASGLPTQGAANGINDGGVIVGFQSGRAVVWASDGALPQLLPLLGGSNSTALAINAAGSIIGQSDLDVGNSRAVLWKGGMAIDLGTLNGDPSVARGINAQGQIVGSTGSGSSARGFFCGAGGMVDLNTLLAAGSGATVTAANDINVYGQIAGTASFAGENRAVLLTPTGSFTNQGLVAGSGTLNAALTNHAAGQVRSVAGDSLQVLGSGHSNAGVIDISAGGQQRYAGALDNAASGRILLNNAVLRLDDGMSNAGQVQVSFGGATVYGAVVTQAGGKLILSGNSDTTFFDAVAVESGGELRVSDGSTGVFFGLVTQHTGSLFTSTGSKFYEGGLSVGASPGLGSHAGSVNFGTANTYTAEMGGASACTVACATDATLRDHSFDKYVVAGHLGLGGTLRLVSWAGFTGQIGQSFDLLDWGSASGIFSNIDTSGLALDSGAALDFSQLYSTGVVSITVVPEPRTWALPLCGLGLILRRQRPRRSAA
jgi:probable HAF family extracellular repeat protein